MPHPDQGSVRSVSRALEIMLLIGDNPLGLTLWSTVAATGLPKTTVLRLLQNLETYGLVWKADTQTYVPGPALLHLTDMAGDTWRLRQSLANLLERLAEDCNETVNLWVRRGIQRACVWQAHGQSLRRVARPGDLLPLDSGASAKVLLTAAPDEILREVAANSTRGPGHLAALRTWVADAQANGWALSHGEREEGLSAVAVPVFSRAGTTVAALTLSGATSHFGPGQLEHFISGLRSCAGEIGRQGFGAFGAVGATG